MQGCFFMKKISVFLLSLIICFSFIGCSAEINVNFSDNGENSTAVSQGETETNEENSKAEENSETNKNGETVKAEKDENSSQNSSQKNSDNKKSDEKESNKNSNNTTEKSQNTNSDTEKTTKASSAPKKTTTKSYITCSVTIECSVVLKNMDDLKDGHQKYVPSDGYIISNTSVSVKNGSTAYDAVKAACSKMGVKISTTGSGKSVYITGFNNIDEFDCGSGSGWTYYVNNTFPPKSCGAYTLSDGDSIRFSYVC